MTRPWTRHDYDMAPFGELTPEQQAEIRANGPWQMWSFRYCWVDWGDPLWNPKARYRSTPPDPIPDRHIAPACTDIPDDLVKRLFAVMNSDPGAYWPEQTCATVLEWVDGLKKIGVLK